jgi:ureidoglycolate lyase
MTVEPLEAATVVVFGMVHEAPPAGGRVEGGEGLGDARAGAHTCLARVRLGAAAALPSPVRQLERHRHSSQTFLPLDDADVLVLVAPPWAGKGLPDVRRVRAFRAAGGQGVTDAAGTWHHPLTALTAPARFAVRLRRDDGPEDEAFVDVAPFLVTF